MIAPYTKQCWVLYTDLINDFKINAIVQYVQNDFIYSKIKKYISMYIYVHMEKSRKSSILSFFLQ